MGETVRALDLPRGSVALDAGSSTATYRRATQPHLERNVLGPLTARGIEIRSLDMRAAPGVDYVYDLTAPGFDWSTTIGRRFDLVLFNNVLVHFADPHAGAASVASLVAPGGWLLASTPSVYRRVRDPLDNGMRPEPHDLERMLTEAGGPARFHLVERGEIRIDDRSYYRRSPLAPSWFLIARRWMPVPGIVEQFRYLVPRMRWRVSCVLLRRAAERPETQT